MLLPIIQQEEYANGALQILHSNFFDASFEMKYSYILESCSKKLFFIGS